MPIRRDLRHFYRTQAWRALVALLKKRSGNRCEWCGKPNGKEVWTRTGGGAMWWRKCGRDLTWRDHQAQIVTPYAAEWQDAVKHRLRRIRVVCTGAHLNHQPGDDRPENAAYLCQWCHLHFDLGHHVVNSRQTRKLHKDQARPLLQEAIA